LLEIAFFAVVAALILGRLYQVLGRKTGADRRETPVLAPNSDVKADNDIQNPAPVNAYVGPGAAGIEAIIAADPTFTVDSFVGGAKAAYEMIVTAFAEGDVATLQPLLSDEVFSAYKSAIEARAPGEMVSHLVRLVSARIVEAELTNTVAQVSLAFSAELSSGENGLKSTNEIWTFERIIPSRDPNWRLVAVDAAQ
jgi:predicted lipid-binding transport protein (Tim44 family)